MVVRGHELAERAQSARHLVEDGPIPGVAGGVVVVRQHVLLEPRDAQAGRAPDRSGVGRGLARDHFQQARLARAVAADERDALARLDAKIGRLEKRQVTEGQGDGVEGE